MDWIQLHPEVIYRHSWYIDVLRLVEIEKIIAIRSIGGGQCCDRK